MDRDAASRCVGKLRYLRDAISRDQGVDTSKLQKELAPLLEDPYQIAVARAGKQQKTEMRGGKRTGVCWSCGSTDHYQPDCPEKRGGKMNAVKNSAKHSFKKLEEGQNFGNRFVPPIVSFPQLNQNFNSNNTHIHYPRKSTRKSSWKKYATNSHIGNAPYQKTFTLSKSMQQVIKTTRQIACMAEAASTLQLPFYDVCRDNKCIA